MTVLLLLMAFAAAAGFLLTLGDTSCFTVICALAIPILLLMALLSWVVGDPYDCSTSYSTEC